MTEHPGEQFPPAVDPDVEPGADPRTEEPTEPDYDSEPEPESMHSFGWVNPTLQGRAHPDPLLAGFTRYGDPSPAQDDFRGADDSEQAFEASLEQEPAAESYDEAEVVEAADEPATVPEAGYEPVTAAEPAEVRDEPDTVAGVAAAPTVPSPAVIARQGPPGAQQHQPQAQYRQELQSRSQQAEPQYQQQQVREAGEVGTHPLVEETMARLDELRDRPVGEHAEVYADLHERLQSALVEADAEHGDRV